MQKVIKFIVFVILLWRFAGNTASLDHDEREHFAPSTGASLDMDDRRHFTAAAGGAAGSSALLKVGGEGGGAEDRSSTTASASVSSGRRSSGADSGLAAATAAMSLEDGPGRIYTLIDTLQGVSDKDGLKAVVVQIKTLLDSLTHPFEVPLYTDAEDLSKLEAHWRPELNYWYRIYKSAKTHFDALVLTDREGIIESSAREFMPWMNRWPGQTWVQALGAYIFMPLAFVHPGFAIWSNNEHALYALASAASYRNTQILDLLNFVYGQVGDKDPEEDITYTLPNGTKVGPIKSGVILGKIASILDPLWDAAKASGDHYYVIRSHVDRYNIPAESRKAYETAIVAMGDGDELLVDPRFWMHYKDALHEEKPLALYKEKFEAATAPGTPYDAYIKYVNGEGARVCKSFRDSENYKYQYYYPGGSYLYWLDISYLTKAQKHNLYTSLGNYKGVKMGHLLDLAGIPLV
jgi:hypothetical protein